MAKKPKDPVLAIGRSRLRLPADAQERLARMKPEERESAASEADARYHWLREFAEHLEWFERFLDNKNDDYLAWYIRPSSLDLFDHGITAERVAEAIRALERARVLTFGGSATGIPSTGDGDSPMSPPPATGGRTH